MARPNNSSFDEATPDNNGFAAPAADDPSLYDGFASMDGQRPKAGGHLGPAFFAGLVVAVLCAGVWAAITILAEIQIGWIAIAVGALVGISVRKVGKGTETVFGVLGAGLAIFGCLLGDLITTIYTVAEHLSIEPLSVITSADAVLFKVFMASTLDPMTLIFYAIAAYEAYRFSFVRMDTV